MSEIETNDFSEAFYTPTPELGCDTIFDPIAGYLIRDYWRDSRKERLEVITNESHPQEFAEYRDNVLENSQIKLDKYRQPIPKGPLNLRVFTGLIPRVSIDRVLVENLFDKRLKYDAAREIALQAKEQARPEDLCYIRAPILDNPDEDEDFGGDEKDFGDDEPFDFDDPSLGDMLTKQPENSDELYDTLAKDPNRNNQKKEI